MTDPMTTSDTPDTHYVEWDAIQSHWGFAGALCGDYVEVAIEHSTMPTCAICMSRKIELEQMDFGQGEIQWRDA